MSSGKACCKGSSVWENRAIFIDAHCHTFNGSDLPVEGFLSKVRFNYDEEILESWRIVLAKLVRLVAYFAPDASTEDADLDRRLGTTGEMSQAALADAMNTLPDQPDPPGPGEEDLIEALQDALDELARSSDPGDRGLLAEIRREVDAGMSVHGDDADAQVVCPIDEARWLARALLQIGGDIGRQIKWTFLLKESRFELTGQLIKLYGQNHGCIDLFTPALVDYDNWVLDRPDSSLSAQIPLWDKLIRLYRGRIHPFVGFDPWREADHHDGPRGALHWVKQAITRYGFLGVKLHPPMGYSPIGNEQNDFSGVTDEDSAKFGRRLDRALNEMYEWCAENGVPVMAHCKRTQELREGYAERAHPAYWGRVIETHPDLRVNLAHFAGPWNLAPDKHGWPWRIGELMDCCQHHVYSDISNFARVVDPDERKKVFDLLEQFLEKHPNAHGRLMFGTDWAMLARAPKVEDYFRCFSEEYLDRFGEQHTADFLGGNAARFLGLHPGDENRKRLEAYYKTHQLQQPDWMARLL